MAFARMILAALIATSLALVPIGGTAVSTSTTPVKMLIADQADMPCCPPQGKGSLALFKCICAVAMLPATIAIPQILNGLPSFFVGATLHGYVSHPTHPPPI